MPTPKTLEALTFNPSPPPEPPYTIFTPRQRFLLLILVSTAATFSAFASNIYFPALPSIAQSLHVSTDLINLTVTLYLIFQALSPTLWGALSDVHGRRITYIGTLAIFVAACVGLALSQTFPQLLILRCLQSTGSASTVAVGAGVLGDITTREERGGFMGVYQGIVLVPLAIGPVLGGVFADRLGWRSIFWFLALFAAVFLVLLSLLLPETLRALVGNGSIPARGAAESPLARWQRHRLGEGGAAWIVEGRIYRESRKAIDEAKRQKKGVDLLGPLKILIQLQATFAIFVVAIFYTVWQVTLTALSALLQDTYGMTSVQIGLVFVANGAGCMMGTILTGRFLDFEYRRTCARFAATAATTLCKSDTLSPNEEEKEEAFPLEQARLGTAWLYGGVQIGATLAFGWAVDRAVHVSLPIACLFFIGWTAVSIQSVVTTFLIDIYAKRSASATAALNLVRCLLGAAGTAAVRPTISAVGVGWCFTLFAAMLFGCFGLLVGQMTLGKRARLRCIREGE